MRAVKIIGRIVMTIMRTASKTGIDDANKAKAAEIFSNGLCSRIAELLASATRGYKGEPVSYALEMLNIQNISPAVLKHLFALIKATYETPDNEWQVEMINDPDPLGGFITSIRFS